MHSMHESTLVEETSSGIPTSALSPDETTRPINVWFQIYLRFSVLIMNLVLPAPNFSYKRNTYIQIFRKKWQLFDGQSFQRYEQQS